ncbi:CbtB-domain containing protein [Nitratireductor mangrovi]|uniref:CbtB-domain containing protein n=1 Tax=Nitratireductor mangrovi TaxID=2599600 RepID=A0A5B8L1C3_9HYPH|nr:CbtB-domain containing protein [Nitratireductor mangrovi]QDZ01623.1 CbtB-domain containing protein [Nitratireductor mangrovi]
MTANTTTLGTAATAKSRVMPLLMAALLGVVIIGVSGFAHMEVVHNAGHDYRHSMAFPCH